MNSTRLNWADDYESSEGSVDDNVQNESQSELASCVALSQSVHDICSKCSNPLPNASQLIVCPMIFLSIIFLY